MGPPPSLLGPSLPNDANLVGHWKLDETTGTTAIDYASSNNGTMQGGLDAATDSVDGRVKTALNFDGAGDYINLSAVPISTQTYDDFTISSWYKSTNTTPADDQYIFVTGNPNSAGTNPEWLFGVGDDPGHVGEVRFHMRWNSIIGEFYSDGVVVMDQTWRYLAAVRGSGRVKIYVDGLLITDAADPFPGVTIDQANDNHTFIGDDPGATEQVNGSLDDVRIYDRALSADEIAQLYRARDGHVVYNLDARVPEFFNGDQWVPMGPPKPTATGLVGHWKLDEASGTLADSSGNGNDGTQSGGIDYASSGIIGAAAGFDGVDDYVDTTYQPVYGVADDFSFSMWIKPSIISGVIDDSLLSSSDANVWVMFEIDRDGTVCNSDEVLIDVSDAGAGADFLCSNVTINDTNWHNVAFTYDVDENLFLYIDGIQRGSIAVTANSNGLKDFSGEPFYIGAKQQGALPGENFHGAIDDVRIYNRALNPAEIGDLYKMSPYALDITNGLVGHWRLDEVSGTTAVNAVNPGTHDGTLNNFPADPWDEAGGKVLGALTFGGDGGNDRVDIPDHADLNPADWTLSSWFYVNNTTADGAQKIFDKRNGVGGVDYHMDFNQPANALRCRFKDNPTNASVVAQNNDVVVSTGEWHYGACVYDSTANTLTAYLDGTVMEVQDTTGFTPWDTTGPLYLGANSDGAWDELDGLIDDARLYNRALSDEEIQALYHLTGMCATPPRAGGKIIYNNDGNIFQYCDGQSWNRVGQ